MMLWNPADAMKESPNIMYLLLSRLIRKDKGMLASMMETRVAWSYAKNSRSKEYICKSITPRFDYL